MKTNRYVPKRRAGAAVLEPGPVTHEGGRAMIQDAETLLARTAAACLLWEGTYYESGPSIAQRLAALVRAVSPQYAADIAVRAREQWYLRHVPLWLAVNMADAFEGRIVGDTIAKVIQRADELTEFVSLWWKGKKRPLTRQIKRGLREAFLKFDAYQLAKYDREAPVRLRDVAFLTHVKPKTADQGVMIAKLVNKTGFPDKTKASGFSVRETYALEGVPGLPAPDTWEVALSAGQDKKTSFESLLREKKLGYFALIRNLRNMEEAKVDRDLVRAAVAAGGKRILPFRFVAAMRAAPSFADALEKGMIASIKEIPSLPGRTALVIDVSGSMDAPLSERGVAARIRHGYDPGQVITRIDAAAALAMLLRETGSDVRVFTFSNSLVEVPNVRGFGLLAAIHNSQEHGGTYLEGALNALRPLTQGYDRIIVVTDEQAHDGIAAAWTPKAFVVNCAPYAPALDTRQGWVRVNGFSDRILDWIRLEESADWRVSVTV